MPSKTAKQAVAMRIAAAGKSNIGIPKSVGLEFVKEDRKVAHKEEYGKETQGEAGKRNRRVMAKSHNYAGMNPGYKQRSPMPKYSTGGTMAGGVGNTEYRHDGPHKSRNPTTRGTKDMGYATGYGSRNKQTPGNYYVQDGAMKMQKSMVMQMRGGNAGVSSAEMKGGKYHNPHRGGY